MIQRVKDSDRFEHDLTRPPPGVMATEVTVEDLDEDASAFMAFAGVLGIKPPIAPVHSGDDEVIVESASSTDEG